MEKEFYNERRAMESALYNASRTGAKKAREKYHIGSYRPKSVREFISMIKADKFKPINEEDMDAELAAWDCPMSRIELRMMPEDVKGFEVAEKIRDRDYEAALLDVKVLPPAEALAKVRTFESKYVN